MSICATNWAWSLQDITPTEKLILLSYADRSGESMEAWPSKSRLHFDTGLCLNTIDKGLKSLTKKGKIIRTGEFKNQVPVYKLLGVIGREEAKNQPKKFKKNQPPPKMTPPKNDPPPPPKNGGSTPPKNGIQNHQWNLQRNPKGEPLSFSSFSDFKNFVSELVKETGKHPQEVLVEEIMFYAEKFQEKRLPYESIMMAISLIKNGKWKTPHGFKGFSFKAIVEAEERQEKQKQDDMMLDARMARQIKKVVTEGSGFKGFQAMVQQLKRPSHAH
jgi:hypothetical protein